MIPTKEDFDSWRESMVTQAVFDALERKAEEAKERWTETSWAGGLTSASAELLADLRASAGAWDYVRNMDHEELEVMLGNG